MTRKNDRPPRRVPACIYCQERPGTTKDHVVPTGIYDPPYPPNLMTVKACETCNIDDKSKGDTDLRDYLVLDKDGCTHPTTEKNLHGKFKRSVQEGHSRIGKSAARTTVQPNISRGGIYVGDYPTAEIDDAHITSALAIMVRRLSYKAGKHVIPPEYVIWVKRVLNHEMKSLTRRVASLGPLGFVRQGEYLFEAAYLRADAEPATSLRLLLI